MAAYRQINVVVGNGKKLATLMNKRNKIVRMRVFIGLFCFCNLICRYLSGSVHTIQTDNKEKKGNGSFFLLNLTFHVIWLFQKLLLPALAYQSILVDFLVWFFLIRWFLKSQLLCVFWYI